MILLFACSAAVLCYVVHFKESLLLWLIVWARGPRPPFFASNMTPSMSLAISAFTRDAIGRKLENALVARTTRPGLLEIVVVSDASDDGTDAPSFAGTRA